MKKAFRILVAVVAGLAVAFVVVVAVEMFSAIVHPVPADFGGTMEEMCRHVERYPDWVLAAAVLMWGFTAFAGTWTARKIGNVYCAAIVGLVLLAALVLNVSMLPYPLWFKIVILLAIPIAAALGSGLLVRRGRA